MSIFMTKFLLANGDTLNMANCGMTAQDAERRALARLEGEAHIIYTIEV